jgi:ATP-dependent DNA ligase
MKPLQMIEVLKRFNFRCALTDSEDYHIEHWLPQAKGGQTAVENCYPLDAELNLKKGKQNPFVFFEREDIRCRFGKERFDELVFWLAINNDLTVEEFRDFTFWAYEHNNPNVEDWKKFKGGLNMYQEIFPMRAQSFDYPNASREEWQDEDFIYEVKYDGERQLIHIMEDKIYMTGRRPSDVNGKLPEKGGFVPQLTDFNIPELYGTILDGELIHPKGDFDLLRSIMGSGTAERAIRIQESHGFLQYITYDLLYFKGENVMNQPFECRRELLEEVFEIYRKYVGDRYVHLAVQFHPSEYDIQKVFNDVVAAGGEGLMRKRLSGKYKICDGSKKSSDIQKLKKILTFDGVVMGYEYGKGKYNKDKIAKLVFGQYKDGELVERGAFDGFTKAAIEDMTANIDKYIGRIVEVKANEVLKSGKLRHPKFNRWRDDKDSKQCVWE